MILKKRKYQLKEEDRQFLDYMPPAAIFLGGIIFLGGTILAMILYQTPNGGYQFIHQFFSELGIRHDVTQTLSDGSTRIRYAPPHPDVFNISLYMSGFLIMPFFLFSYRQMRNENRFSNVFLLLATTTGFIAGPMLIGVGIFDISTTGTHYWQTHDFWAGGLYLLITITSLLWIIMILASCNLPYRDLTKWIWLDYAFLIILAFLAVLNITDALNILNAEDIPLIRYFPLQLYQKLIAYIFFMYFGLVVGGRLSKTKYDNTPVHPTKLPKSFFCTNCGTENDIHARKCKKCGQKLNKCDRYK